MLLHACAEHCVGVNLTMAYSLQFTLAIVLLAYIYARLQYVSFLNESHEISITRASSKFVASELLKRGRLWRDLTGRGAERLKHKSLTNRPHWFLDSLLLLAGDIELNPGPVDKGIRPVPDVKIRGKFVMCDGLRCKGVKCTYPHSEAEKRVWNSQRFGELGPIMQPQNWQQPVPLRSPEGRGTSITARPNPIDVTRKSYLSAAKHFLPMAAGASDSAFPNTDITTEPMKKKKPSDRRVTVPDTERRYVQNLTVPLTFTNYKRKFVGLLRAEENEHRKILASKGNRQCCLHLYEKGSKKSKWLEDFSKPNHVQFAFLTGFDDDVTAYVAQASGRLTITRNKTSICKADVLRVNTFTSVENSLYIGFNEDNSGKIMTNGLIQQGEGNHVYVEFELKHFYFKDLKQAIENLPDDVITKLLPEASDFQLSHLQIHDEDLKYYEAKCSPDQFRALKVIASCPATSPPVIISGAFGTGKTRLLAIASQYFMHTGKKTTGHVSRVLVCTQQWVSADFFLKCYRGLMDSEQNTNVYVVKDYCPKWKSFYMTVDELKHFMEKEGNRSQNMLIITTCHTAPRLLSRKAVPFGFFTHILLDEGAQTREPEAIAPLTMAATDTKIVIAGDKNQVGPTLLVLGDEARENGLAVSLQQRLEERYQSMGVLTHMATLNTSYRCHKDILELVGELFYDVQFRMPTDQNPPTTHPLAPYPLLFVCSSIDSDVDTIKDAINEAEAEVLLDEVVKFSSSWPHLQWGQQHLSQMCVMSSSQKQLSVVKNALKKRDTPKLSELQCTSTFNIQGKEYHAVFLSTSEHTEFGGYTSNPTKSLCDPYIFNTAITRAQSLVISVGNPFMLLKMEKYMIEIYGNRGKCWSSYLKKCLEHHTVSFHDSLKLTDEQKTELLQKLQANVKEALGAFPDVSARAYNCEMSEEFLDPSTGKAKAREGILQSQVHSRSEKTPPLPIPLQKHESTGTGSNESYFTIFKKQMSESCVSVPQEKYFTKAHRSQSSEESLYHKKDDDSRAVLVKLKPTKGKQIGIGSFGYVCEMHCGEKKYAGKFFREEFIYNSAAEDFHTKFQKESMVLSHLHHNNIVEYCGVCFPEDHGFYCLLMELLHCSLDTYINDYTREFLIKVNLLLDVAKGLSYLHCAQYPVIHRDLTARNVLLTSDTPPTVAKISDFGNARVIDPDTISERKSLTKEPGTSAYMPPEALSPDRTYDEKLDIFSFGHLALYTITQKKIKLLSATYHGCNNMLLARSEVQRREESLMNLQKECKSIDGTMVPKLITECLDNDPKKRPNALNLVAQLEAVVKLNLQYSETTDSTTS